MKEFQRADLRTFSHLRAFASICGESDDVRVLRQHLATLPRTCAREPRKFSSEIVLRQNSNIAYLSQKSPRCCTRLFRKRRVFSNDFAFACVNKRRSFETTAR